MRGTVQPGRQKALSLYRMPGSCRRRERKRMKMVNIAVLGYGTVGSGVVEVMKTNQESINKKAGQEINIKYVLDLRDFPGDPIQDKIVHDYNLILNDDEVEIGRAHV